MEDKEFGKYLDVGGKRYYITPIGILPSVTTILSVLDKPLLKQWIANSSVDYIFEELQKYKIATGDIDFNDENIIKIFKDAKGLYEQKRQKSADIGSIVHNIIEKYIKSNGNYNPTDEDFQTEKAKNSFNSFLMWVKEFNFQPLKSEIFVYSKLGYAGTLDCIGFLNNKKYLIDFKTSKDFYESFPLQLSAYFYAYEEMKNEKLDGMAILRLDKNTGLPFFKDYTELKETYFEMFKSLLNYFKLKEKLNETEKKFKIF